MFAVPLGARVDVTGSDVVENTGLYRVSSRGIGYIAVDRNLAGADTALRAAIYTKYVGLAATGTTATSGLGVAPGAGASATGLTTTGEVPASLSGFELSGSGDLLLRGVRAGDIAVVASPTAVEYDGIASPTSTTAFTLAPAVPYEAGNWTYVIRGVAAAAYAALQPDAATYLASTYAQDFPALDRLMTRLLGGARFTSDISAAVALYRDDLNALRIALNDYVVPRETTIDAAVRMMQEQGLDRALDLLLSLSIVELFSMDADGVSYSTWLIRRSADAAREVAPISRFANSEQINSGIRIVSSQPRPYDPGSDDGAQ